MDGHHFLETAVVFLLATVIAVPLTKRFRLGAVLGYLLAGVAIGPSALGLVSDTEGVAAISDFGVVLMLVVIGLELSPSRLWVMRRAVFGSGTDRRLTPGHVFATLKVTATNTCASGNAEWDPLLLHRFERVDNFVCQADKDLGLDLFLAAAKHSRRTCLLLGKSSDRLMGREITQHDLDLHLGGTKRSAGVATIVAADGGQQFQTRACAGRERGTIQTCIGGVYNCGEQVCFLQSRSQQTFQKKIIPGRELGGLAVIRHRNAADYKRLVITQALLCSLRRCVS